MKTSFTVTSAAEVVFEFACGLSAAGRVFTMRQLARHPELSWRTQPVKRASEMLSAYRSSFELIPWENRYLWRMTDKEKQKRGLRYRNVSASQHVPHWLALGDMWANLVFHGLRPERWFTEGKEIGRFDVFMMVQGVPYLVELQRTPLTEHEWKEKWKHRAEWVAEQKWKEEKWAREFFSTPPRVLLVTTKPMDVVRPKGVTHCELERLHNILRPPQK